MSCLPESTYSIYIDGELSTDETHAVEAHLVDCQRCRSLILALRDEATWLGDVLQERRRAPLRRRAATAAPARGLAIGLVPSLALLGLVVTVLGWLLELRAPAAIGWMNPLNLMGAYQMAFDLIFWIRDQAPGLVELVLALAATASVSALLSFALSLILRRFAGPAALVLAFALVSVPASPGSALELVRQEDYSLTSGDRVEGSLAVSGENVRIDGVVGGDLFVLAERVVLRGKVEGNLFAVAEELELSGEVEGSSYTISENSAMEGVVKQNLYAIAERFRFHERADVGRDLTVLMRRVEIEGKVGRDVISWCKKTDLRGSVGRNLHARHQLSLLDGSRVDGDVFFSSHHETEIEMSAGAVVAGQTHTDIHEHPLVSHLDQYRRAHFYLYLCVFLTAAFLVGMAFHLTVPRIFDVHLRTASDFFRSLGVGFLSFIAAPCALLITALTIVGIPLALIAAALYLTTLYLSGIVLSAVVGAAILPRQSESLHAFGLTLLVGLAVLTVAASFPYVGALVRIVIVLSGLGLLTDRARAAWRAVRVGAG